MKRSAALKRRTPLRKESASPTRFLQKALWNLCRIITFQVHGTDCYTCPAKNLTGSNLQCGHFIRSSVCSTFMRYFLDHLRPQCKKCNIDLDGNPKAFEAHLRADGVDIDELKRLN